MRQVVFADDDFHVDAEIVGMAQDFDHAPNRPRALFGILDQLDVYHHAVQLFDGCSLWRRHADAVHGRPNRRKFQALGDLDPLLNTVVLRDHEVAAAVECETRPPPWDAPASAL